MVAGLALRLGRRRLGPGAHHVASGLYLVAGLAFRQAWVAAGHDSARDDRAVAEMARTATEAPALVRAPGDAFSGPPRRVDATRQIPDEERGEMETVSNRWVIAAAGVAMQLMLGAVYAWSVFRIPLSEHYGASVTEVNIIFSLSIFFLGIAAYFGGLWMTKVGPRRVGMTAGLLYGAGILLASLAEPSIVILYLTYGVLAGIGLGFGYIVPVATLIKWFPDRRGFITGVAVMGFGAGALITAPVANTLIEGDAGVFGTFAILGAIYLVVVVGAASLMKNPPEGWKPEGFEPEKAVEEDQDRVGVNFEFGQALKRWQWYALWGLLFLNVTAGIAILAEADPIAQEVAGVSGATAALFVSLISIGNGAGRFLWAWLSDFIGRRNVFLTMFLFQAVLFALIPLIGSTFVVFSILGFLILTCYGGGFGTMPAFTADYFGSKNVGPIYGLLLTAWGTAGFAGPLLISAIFDATGSYEPALYALGGVMLVSALLPLFVRPPAKPQGTGAEQTPAPTRVGGAKASEA